MNTILTIVGIAAAAVAVACIFSEKARLVFSNIFEGILDAFSTPAGRQRARVRRAMRKLPQQRARVARLMTAATNATNAVTTKESEVDELLGKYETAEDMKASDATKAELKTRWKTAKDSLPKLKENAVAAQRRAEDAQTELEGFLTLIRESEAGVEAMESDADLAATIRESTAVRNELNDLKKGLGDSGADAKKVRDDLENAKNEDLLSRGSSADREMENLERQKKVKDAGDEIAAALAERRAKKTTEQK